MIFMSQQAGYNVFAAHLGEGKGLVSGFAFPFNTNKHGIISHVGPSITSNNYLDIFPDINPYL
jgi:hypothetical protein